jgi:hypothetical protein
MPALLIYRRRINRLRPKAKQTDQQKQISEVSLTRSSSRFVGVLRLPRLRNTRFHGRGLRDRGTGHKRVLSFKQRRCNETNQYHPTQQSPHENYGLPGNENQHGGTSEDEGRLTIYRYCTAKTPHLCSEHFASPAPCKSILPPWSARGGTARVLVLHMTEIRHQDHGPLTVHELFPSFTKTFL